MKSLLILLLSIYPLLNFAQSGFSDGYIITYENDTIYGKIKDRGGSMSSKNYLQIRFMKDNEEVEKLSAYDIKGYSKEGFIHYRSIQIESKYFAQVIEEGPVILMILEKSESGFSTNSYGLTTGSTKVYSKYYLQKSNSDEVILINKSNFKKKMSGYFVDYPELKQQIENKSLRYTDILLVVRKYNQYIISGQ